MIYQYIHHLTWAQYDSLRMPETTMSGTTWKTLETEGLGITFYAPIVPPVRDHNHERGGDPECAYTAALLGLGNGHVPSSAGLHKLFGGTGKVPPRYSKPGRVP